MALDEVVKYKIELDQDDLGTQLDAVRQQIDAAMGRDAAFATPLPSLANFMAPTTGFDNAGALATFQDGVTNTMGMLDQMAQSAQLGFNKFTGDMRRIGLMQPSAYPDFTAPLSRVDAHLPQSFFGRVGAATLGTGYDPRGPLSRGAYGSAVREELGEDIGDFFAENAAGLFGLAVGGIVGGGLGMAADVGLGFLRGRISDRNELYEGISNLANLSIGNMSKDARLTLATDLEAYTTSFRGQLDDITKQDIQEVLSTFSNAGGFQGMQGTQDFTQTVKGVVENVRTVAHALGVFQEEAAAIMGGLQQKGITTMGGVGGFAIMQQAMGTSIGMSGLDFMQFGMRGAEMVRGAGLGATAGFEMAQSSLLATDALMMANPASNFMIRDAGGRETSAMAMAETILRFDQSAIGSLDVYNYMGGGGIGGTLQEKLAGATNFLSTPENYLTSLMTRGAQTAAVQEQRGFFGGTMNMVNTVAEQLQSMGMAATPGNIGGLMISQGMASPQQATNLVNLSMLGEVGMRNITGDVQMRTMEGIMQETSVSIPAKITAAVGAIAAAIGFDPAGVGVGTVWNDWVEGYNRETYDIVGALREDGPTDVAAIRAGIAKKEAALYGPVTIGYDPNISGPAGSRRIGLEHLNAEEQAIYSATKGLEGSEGGQLYLSTAKRLGWDEAKLNRLRDNLTLEIAEKGTILMPENDLQAEKGLEGYKEAGERFFGTKGKIDYSKVASVSSAEAMKAWGELKGKDAESFGRLMQSMYGSDEAKTATAITYIADAMKKTGYLPVEIREQK